MSEQEEMAIRLAIVECGCCGRKLRRPRHAVGNNDLPYVLSRTLVKGEFLPSCSEPCLARLRMQIGDRKRVA